MKIIKPEKLTGMTMIELMLTFSLISILLLVAFIMFDNETNTERSISAAQQIAFAIKKSRYYARYQGTQTMLSFPVNGSNYSIIADGVNIVQNSNFDATSGILPTNTQILSNSCNNIYFSVDGSIVDSNNNLLSSDCQITVGTSINTEKTVLIKAGSGNVIYE